MHEFSLYGQITHDRHHQVLSILAGVTGMQPIEIDEQYLIYAQCKPLPESEAAAAPTSTSSSTSTGGPKKSKIQQSQPPHQPAPGLSKSTEVLHHQSLHRDILRPSSPGPWHILTTSTPEPGSTALLSRTINPSQPASESLLALFRDPTFYRFCDQHVIAGHRFVQGNLSLRLYRVLVPVSHVVGRAAGAAGAIGDPISSPPLRHLEQLKLADVTGRWMMDAKVTVATTGEEGTDVNELLERARKELVEFRETMRGCVELKCPDRLAFDTRVKGEGV